ECGLLPISQKAMRFYGRIGYHPYEGPAVNLEERKRLAEHLGTHNALILVNHGLLMCGSTIPEAFNSMLALERACEIQVAAIGVGAGVTTPGQAVMERTAHLFEPKSRRPYGILEWPGLLRMLDR